LKKREKHSEVRVVWASYGLVHLMIR